MRHSGRQNDEIRKIEIIPHFNPYAEGSCLIKCGNTHVICTASVEDKVPSWLKGQHRGWVTAEYAMLPRSTETRVARELKKPSGRTQEIQRLIGRALRAVVNLEQMEDVSITIDCDVLQADGGTRTASITGGFVALYLALQKLADEGRLTDNPVREYVAAISCGIYDGEAVLDVDYIEDSHAQADTNFVLTESGGIVEIQGTAEGEPFSEGQFAALMGLARKGISELIAKQKAAIAEARPRPEIKKLVVASHNEGKIKEIETLLKPFNVEVHSAAELNLPDVEETGTTFVENARLKAETLAKLSGMYCLADDSGLCVNCLGGRPGVYSARYAPNRDFNKGMDMLLKEIKGCNNGDRSAYFACVLALSSPEGRTRMYEGRVNGRIAEEKSGSNGFGYDPIFVPEGYEKSFANFSGEEKNKISHRGRAFRKLMKDIFE